MATNFPTSLDNLTNPAGSDPVNNPSHASQHANLNDAIEVLEAKVGVNNSAVTTSLDYRVRQLETNPTYTNEEAVDAVALALAAGTHSNITINYNDTGNSISISAAAGYTDEEARDAVALALRGSGGITISSDDTANTITISVDSTIATKTYVDTAVSNLGSTAASTYVLDSSVGNPDGVASLDSTGQVPFSQLGNIVNSAPATLDTLNELATALGNDANFATTTATSIGNKVSKAGGDIITSSLPGVIPLVLKGAASQTANLQEWQNSSGNTVARIDSGGNATLANVNLGLLTSYSDYRGTYGIGGGGLTTSAGAFAMKSWIPTIVTGVLRGAASQTANLQEWQNSAGGVLLNIDSTGNLDIGAGSSNLWRIKNQATAVMEWQPNQGFMFLPYGASNRPITVRGAVSQTADLQQWQNSSGTVNARIDAYGTFQNGTASGYGAWINVQPALASDKGIIVRGAASQTANLQEWQSSAGTVLASVGSAGTLNINTSGTGTINLGDGVLVKGPGNGFTFNSDINILDGKGLYASLGKFTNVTGITTVPLTVKAIASQTADLQQWQNSTGTAIAKIDSTGAMFTITPATGTNTTQVATTAFVKTAIDTSVQPGAVYQTSAPSSPAVGQIWIDSDEDVTTFDSNIIRRKAITATAGQTVFTADLPFIDGFEQIFMNGLLLVKTTDYATSGGNTVTLTSAAAASDVIEIVSVTGANSVDTYTQAETNALLAANTSVAPLSISANTNLVAKKRYFVTSASALTLTLPASPALNDEIQILDASGNSSTYNITVARNANKINGGENNLIIDTNGGWYTLLYTGSTYGWKVG